MNECKYIYKKMVADCSWLHALVVMVTTIHLFTLHLWIENLFSLPKYEKAKNYYFESKPLFGKRQSLILIEDGCICNNTLLIR